MFTNSGVTATDSQQTQDYCDLTGSSYKGRSKSSRKSAIIFVLCKSAKLNYYSYIDKHDLHLYSKFRCSGMNTMLTVVAMETVHHDYRPAFVHFCKKSIFNYDVVVYRAFFTKLYMSKVCGEHMT